MDRLTVDEWHDQLNAIRANLESTDCRSQESSHSRRHFRSRPFDDGESVRRRSHTFAAFSATASNTG